MRQFLEMMHRRQEALEPSLDLRQKYLEATTAQQQRVERDAVMSRIFHLQPGPRKAFMAARLEALNVPQVLKPEPDATATARPAPRTKVTIEEPKTRRRYTKKSAPRVNEGAKP